MSQIHSENAPSRPEESAPNYDRHFFDQRYHPSAEAIAAETPQLEPHPPLSTITDADLGRSRRTPPPHFFSLLNPTDPLAAINQTENQPLRSPALTNTSVSTAPQADGFAQNSAMANPLNTSPAFLTLDKDLIFPPPPSQALYSLKFAISATGTNNTLRQSVPATQRADGTQRSSVQDKDLYAISRHGWDHPDQFIIEGQRRSTIPGTLELRRHVNMLGRVSWQCRAEKTGEILIRSKGSEWLDAKGQVIGREEGGIVPSRKQKKAIEKANSQRAQGVDVPYKAAVLELVGPARDGTADGDKIRNLLAVCWVGKCWFTEVETNEVPHPPVKRTKHFYSKSLGAGMID